MVASTSHNISLGNASSTSQTIEVSNNLSLISGTPIKTNIDINNVNDESSTLHSMNCIEIDFLRKEKIDLQFRIQCLEEKEIKIEILYYVPFAMTLKYYYRVLWGSQKNLIHFILVTDIPLWQDFNNNWALTSYLFFFF